MVDPYSGNTERSSLFTYIVSSKDFMKPMICISLNMVLGMHYASCLNKELDHERVDGPGPALGFEGWRWELVSVCVAQCNGTGAADLDNCDLRNLELVETTTMQILDLGVPRKTFDSNDMGNLQSLEEKQYCLSLHPNFETMDSWFAMCNLFVEEGNKNLCLLRLQVITTEQHDLQQTREMCETQKAEPSFGVNCWEGNNIHIVFVVLQGNFIGFGKQN